MTWHEGTRFPQLWPVIPAAFEMKSGRARQIKLEGIYSKDFEDFGRRGRGGGWGKKGRRALSSTKEKKRVSNVDESS